MLLYSAVFCELSNLKTSQPAHLLIPIPRLVFASASTRSNMALKSQISTPLEAGVSILDAHRLPAFLIPALEYTSQRLAAKGLHITLVVARRDYQLPDCAQRTKARMSTNTAVTNLPSPPNSPDAMACGPNFTTIKSLVRSGSQHSSRSADKPDTRERQRSKTGTLSKKPPIASIFDTGRGGSRSRLRWSHGSNTTSYMAKTPKTPATPVTPASASTTTSYNTVAAAGRLGASNHGIRLIYTAPLGPRAYKLVAATLARAARKFNLSTPLEAHEPSAYDLPPVVLHGSILQNEVLHSSQGLTMLSLDHLYTFKAALNHYAATRSDGGSHFRLEDAVDELRRYVLSVRGGRRRLLKSVLITAYDWLGPVNDAALGEVMRMYSRAYGGATEMGVEDDLVKRDAAPPAIAACPVLDKAIEEDNSDTVIRLVAPAPEVPPKSIRRLSRMSVGTVTTTKSRPASPEDRRSLSSATTTSTSASFQRDQPLLSPMSGQNWVVEDYTPWADEGMVNIPDTPRGGEDTPAHELHAVSAEDAAGGEGGAPAAADEPPPQAPGTPASPPPHRNVPIPPCPAASTPPSIRLVTPRVAPKASLPSLRVQTSFPPTPKPPKRPTPLRRRETPHAPSHLSHAMALEDLALRPSLPLEGSRDRAADDEHNNNNNNQIERGAAADDRDDEEEPASALTEFEDAELTARSPAAGTPGGGFWLGIDELLLSAADKDEEPQQQQEQQRRRLRPRDHQQHHHHHHRRSSSLHELPTPGGLGALGPATPNGYEDISPITRGEWGFLMVGDSFKTKTAAISCV